MTMISPMHALLVVVGLLLRFTAISADLEDPPVYVNEVKFSNDEVRVEFVCRHGFVLGKVTFQLYRLSDGETFEDGELKNVCENNPNSPQGTGSETIKAKNKNNDDGISVCVHSRKLGVMQFVGFATDVSNQAKRGQCGGMVPDEAGEQPAEKDLSKMIKQGGVAVRLVGKACLYGDFEWVVDKKANMGTVPNKDQVFICTTVAPSQFPSAIPSQLPSAFPTTLAELEDPKVYVNEVKFNKDEVRVEFVCRHGFDLGKVKYQLYTSSDGETLLEEGGLNKVCKNSPKSPQGTGSETIKAKNENNDDGISVCIHSEKRGVILFVGFATDVSNQAKGGKCDGMVPDEAGKQPAEKDLSKMIQKGGVAVGLVGKACWYGDFEWVINEKANIGTVPNKNQVFICITDPPTVAPSQFPSQFPTLFPSILPSQRPSVIPSFLPTVLPTLSPSALPTVLPSQTPSELPSAIPTTSPSQYPSTIPTREPSSSPSAAPSRSTCTRCKEIIEESNTKPNSEGIEIGISIEDENSEGIAIGTQKEDEKEDIDFVDTNQTSSGHAVDQVEWEEEEDGVVTVKDPGIAGYYVCAKKCDELLKTEMDKKIEKVGCENLCKTMIKQKTNPERACTIYDFCD